MARRDLRGRAFAGKVEQCTGKTKFMYPRNLDF